jgi:DNA (cytosine-5)-methyltransferase 1
MTPTLTVGSLFSGIGGLDLGLERAGMTVRWQSEIHPYACRVLAKHWPDVPNLGDITTIDWSTVEPVDLICGGYPCQPFSVAGTRNGADDPRHLWPHMLGAIRLLRPRWALLENVPGHLSLGFGRVLGDLAESGYSVEWDCIPASSVGAPHRRDRVFAVAHADMRRREQRDSRQRGLSIVDASGNDATGNVADTNITGSQGRLQRVRGSGQQPVGSGGQPDPGNWLVEPDVGRVAHGVPSRVDRLKCLGNAVVPQVAEHVGRLIINAHHDANRPV